MAFSLACANLVCSIKEFIPGLEGKKTGNQKDLVQMSYITECSPQKCFSSPWKYLLVVLACSSNKYFAYDPQFSDRGQKAKIPVKCTCKAWNNLLLTWKCTLFWIVFPFFRKIYLAWNTSFLSLDVHMLFI